MKISIATAALLSATFLFTACKKENTAEKGASTFAFELKTSNPASVLNRSAGLRTEGASIQWTSGTASAYLLKFEARNAGGEVEIKQAVQQTIDLFAAASVLGRLTVPAGTYTEVGFKAFLASTAANNALVLNGTFASGNTTVPVSFRVAASVELKAEKANVTVVAGSTYSALNTLDLSQLTRGVSETDLLNATRSGGTIVLSANSNTALYNTLLNNLGKHHGEAEVEHD